MAHNGKINVIIEQYQDKIFIKPSGNNSTQSTYDHTNNNKSVLFNSSHYCDENDCECIFQFLKMNTNTLIYLELSYCNLKFLPDALGNLPLKLLNVSHNLFKSVPNCIVEGLECLEELDLSNNNVQEFETTPKCVLNLRKLNLTSNNMQYIPIWIVHVKSRYLRELHYSNNKLGKTDESLYDKVSGYSLDTMVLQNSQIENGNISFIKSVSTLSYLNISNTCSTHKNVLTDYEHLFNNPDWKINLKLLDMSHLGIGFLPDSLTSLISLKELYLSGNGILWLPDCISNLTNLEILDLSRNIICMLPISLNCLKNLHVLKLQHNNLSDINPLQTLTNIEILDLYENELDSFSFDVSSYKYLDVERNFFNTKNLSDVYVERMELYREKFKLKQRLVGRCETNQDISSDSEQDSPEKLISFSDLEDAGSDVASHCEYEDECWDEENKIDSHKSHPDVTSSDDELATFYIPEAKNKKPSNNLDHLLEYLYVDAD